MCQLSVIPINDDDEDRLSVSSSFSIMSAATSNVSYVIPPQPDYSNQFWWDSYVSQLSQFSAEFYSLLSPVFDDDHEDIRLKNDDDEVRDPVDEHPLRPDDRQSSNPVNLVKCPDRNQLERKLYTPMPK